MWAVAACCPADAAGVSESGIHSIVFRGRTMRQVQDMPEGDIYEDDVRRLGGCALDERSTAVGARSQPTGRSSSLGNKGQQPQWSTLRPAYNISSTCDTLHRDDNTPTWHRTAMTTGMTTPTTTATTTVTVMNTTTLTTTAAHRPHLPTLFISAWDLMPRTRTPET